MRRFAWSNWWSGAGSNRRPSAFQVISGRSIRLSDLTLPSAQCAERCAQFFGKQLRLFPGGEVAAPVGFVEVDQVVVGLLGPAARRLDVLLREHRDGRREGDVGGGVEVAASYA